MMKKILLFAIILVIALNLIHFSVLITGHTTNTGAISSIWVLAPAACSFDLLPEWNLISICANPYNASVTDMTSEFSGKYEYVLRWNDTIQAYEVYSIYAIYKPFIDFNNNESYFIYMNDNATWNVRGALRNDINMSLANKWNAPAYPYELTGNVSRYLETIDGQYEYMLKWDEPTQSYSLWSVYAIYKPFNQIFKGEGQFIFVNDTSALLKYNKSYVTS
jgi:hypothetical protein